ncbi:MAG: LysR family transcriptional regulator [Neomegalonema sp.]
MNLQQLRAMAAIADTGSFSAAGQRLGLTHSAISQQVRHLEQELGVALVDRSFKPPTLTNLGRALVDRARMIQALTEEIRHLGQEDGLVGSLTLGAVPSAMLGRLPHALGALRRAHPGLRCEIHVALSGELSEELRSGRIDAAIATAPQHPIEGLLWTEIAREPLVVMAPADSDEENDRSLLETHPFIWFSRRTWAGQQIEQLLIDRNITVQSMAEVDSLEAIAALVEQGLGVSITPRLDSALAARARVRTVPVGQPQSTRSLAFFERANMPERAACAELLKLLQAAHEPPDFVPDDERP